MKIKIIPPTLVFSSIGICVILFFFAPAFNHIPLPYNFAGLLIAFGGFLFMGKTRDLFRKHSTTLKIAPSAKMITEGPFSISRNPMYLGMSILIFGFSILSTNVLALILPALFCLYVNQFIIPKEENLMKANFGDDYLNYKSQVRKWI